VAEIKNPNNSMQRTALGAAADAARYSSREQIEPILGRGTS